MAFLNDSKLLGRRRMLNKLQYSSFPPSEVVQLIATHTKCIMRAEGADWQYGTRGPCGVIIRTPHRSPRSGCVYTYHVLFRVCRRVKASIEATTKAANECVSTANLR